MSQRLHQVGGYFPTSMGSESSYNYRSEFRNSFEKTFNNTLQYLHAQKHIHHTVSHRVSIPRSKCTIRVNVERLHPCVPLLFTASGVAARSIRLWRLRGLLDLLTTGRPDRAQVSSLKEPITG